MERHGLQRRYRSGSCITADPLPRRVRYKMSDHAGGLLGRIGRAVRKLYRFKEAGSVA